MIIKTLVDIEGLSEPVCTLSFSELRLYFIFPSWLLQRMSTSWPLRLCISPVQLSFMILSPCLLCVCAFICRLGTDGAAWVIKVTSCTWVWDQLREKRSWCPLLALSLHKHHFVLWSGWYVFLIRCTLQHLTFIHASPLHAYFNPSQVSFPFKFFTLLVI